MNAQNRILTVPNIITACRLVLSFALMVLLMFEQTRNVALTAFWVFVVSALSDWIDGFLARRWQAVTVLGKLMDPLADKVLVATALVMLIPLGRVPAWMALLILAREFVVTGLRGVAASTGTVVAASYLGKLKSTTQYIGLGCLIFPAEVFPFLHLPLLGTIIMYLALFFTVWSGFDYFYKLRRIFVEESAS